MSVGVVADKIKPLLSNEKLIICNMPIARYETNVYSVDEDNTLEKIVNHLDKDKIVLLFRPIVKNEVLNKIQKLNNKLCLNAFKKAQKASLPNFKNAHLKVYSE